MKSTIRFETNAPRPDWRERVEAAGLIWHGAGGESYWTEDQHLVLTLKAAETLEDAASELHVLCLEACEQIVRRDWWDRLAIPDAAAGLVQTSWMSCGFIALRPLRPGLGWQRHAETPRIQRRHADLVARGGGDPVAVA